MSLKLSYIIVYPTFTAQSMTPLWSGVSRYDSFPYKHDTYMLKKMQKQFSLKNKANKNLQRNGK